MKFSPSVAGFRRFVLSFIPAIAVFASFAASAQTPTNIQVSSAVLQPSVHRLGTNLGDNVYWDSGQLMKNLVFENPGFEGLRYRVIFRCTSVTATTCTDDNQYNAQPAGYWNGGSYLVLYGAAAGTTGTIVSNTAAGTCKSCGPTITFDKSVALAVGDYFYIDKYFPGTGDAGWADDTGGNGTITTETTDISPNSPGKQAILLTAPTTSDYAKVVQGFDTWSGLSFIQLNGAYEITFRAKALAGNNKLIVTCLRLANGAPTWVNQTVALTNSWQDYKLTFNAAETGSSVGPVNLAFLAQGSTVELDDVSLDQTNSNASNPTAFRDDVVNALKELQPGTIRMMAAGAALGSDLPNQIQVPGARYRMGFNADGTSYPNIAYGIHEFLQLCQTVGADPWITIPTATTPTEMTEFIEYLTGTGSDAWSQLRISRGQTAPWTTVFNKIHLELGNETWNGSFKGESMNYPGYPVWANTVFGAARKTPGFQAANFDLVLSGLAATPGYNQPMLSYSTQHDSFDIAPYLLFSANDESQSLMFGALFAESELWNSPGGEVYNNMQVGAVSPSATASTTAVSVYETNLGTMTGNITKAELDQLTPSVGAGIGHTQHMLQMMRNGMAYQNAFSLPQYEYRRSDGSLARLWGMVVDMGTTNRRRPQFLTQALANSVIGGSMIQVNQLGNVPTWNQPLSSDGVILNGAHTLQTFGFLNNGQISLVLFNLNQTTAMPVTFSGPNAPSGTVQFSQITSANITDNNEFSQVVSPVYQTLSGFNPASTLSLPPFSMTVLTMTSSAAQQPNFSIAAGTFSTSQTVAITSTTPGATIYYTTDGSTPTTSSSVYSGPITVSQTTTINAIAAAANLANSPVGTATYVIQPVAAAPVFSVPTGTYSSGQAVTITDAVAGATIYYTTNGTTPTASSSVYTGPISVSVNETLSAIASAPNYTNSGVTSAVYTIAPPTPAPTFSVAAGTYQKTQYVQISDSLKTAAIHCTQDGSDPTINSPICASGATITTTATLKAIGISPGYSASPITTAVYTIAPYVATPVLSVPGGTYNTPQTVSISTTTPGATIYYTQDQTVPTTSSTKYTGPITVNGVDYLQAIAVAPGYTQSFAATANYVMTVGTPTFSTSQTAVKTNAATTTPTQTVVVLEVTPGAALFYTTNGSTPTTSSTQYTAAFTVNGQTTVKVLGTKRDFVNSPIASIVVGSGTATAATPTFSVAAGTYATTQSVTLADATSGATIYYTTNGTTPTTSSTKYTGAISVNSTETIEAIAVASGYTNSAVASAAYTISKVAATPTFSVAAGTYAATQSVTLADATSGATIYYTTNGTTPTTSSTKYTGAISVASTETIEAVAVASGYTNSAVASAAYTISKVAATPTFSVAAGTYASTQTVTLADATSGAVIYYTTNGTTPTASSTKYAGAISVAATETIKAIAVATGYTNSAVASAAYTISKVAATPTFSLAAGTYAATQSVKLADATTGAVIYYTTNGTTPTTTSTKYTAAISVSATETIKAIAVATGYTNSAVASAAYTISKVAATPTFSVAAGTYAATQSVKLADTTSGAVIYYTTNGTTPTTNSTKYTSAISVTATETVKAIAVASGYTNSAVASAAYTISKAAIAPTFSVAAGTYASTQVVTLADTTPGAVIYYTTNGTAPTTSSTKYTAAISVADTETVKAIAVAAGYTNSAVASVSYTISKVAATPTLSVAAGVYTATQTVTIKDTTPGAVIYYTLNGTTPTTSSTKYTAAITVSTTMSVKAIAVASGYTNSAVASATYTIASAVAPAFHSGEMVMHGSAKLSGTALELTDGGAAEYSVAWNATKVGVASFTTDFTFKLTSATADGFTFTLQNDPKGTWASGGNSSALGFAPIAHSVGIKFDLYNATTSKAQSTTGMLQNGGSPSTQNIDMSKYINLHSGDTMHAALVYNGTTLTETVTDTVTKTVFTQSYTVNIPSILGSTSGYVGFTASTGAHSAVQEILTWQYSGQTAVKKAGK